MYQHKDLMEMGCNGTEFYILTELKGTDWIIHIICKKCGREARNIFGIFREQSEGGLIKIEPDETKEEGDKK